MLPFYLKGTSVIINISIILFVFFTIIKNLKFLTKKCSLYNKKQALVICLNLIGVSTISSIVIPILYGTYDFSYFMFIFTAFIYCCKYITLVILSFKLLGQFDLETFFIYYTRAVCIYIFSTIVFLCIPELRAIWDQIIVMTDRNKELTEGLLYISRYGLQGFSGFMHSYMCNIAMIFVFYLFYIKSRYINKISLIIYTTILLIGSFCYGRVGIIGSGVIVILMLCYYAIIKKKILSLFIISSFLCFILCIIYNYLLTNEDTYYWFSWAFEPFINYIENGEFGTKSSDHLKTMYIIPSFFTTIIGDGLYSVGEGYYKSTDVGFIRPILFYGIINTIILYSSLIVIIISLKKQSRKTFMLIILLSVLFIVYEMKGEAFHYMIMALLPTMFLNNNSDSKELYDK